MKQNKIKRLIVVNENKCIIGIVTQTDIIKNFNKIYDNYRHLLWNSKVYFLIFIFVIILFLINILVFGKP